MIYLKVNLLFICIYFLVEASALNDHQNSNNYYVYDSNKANSSSSRTAKSGLFDSMRDLLWGQVNGRQLSNYEKVKNEKDEIRKRIEKFVKKVESEEDVTEDEEDIEEPFEDHQLVERFIKKIELSQNDAIKRRSLIDRLVEMLKNKYRAKVDKLLLQESILCKINDQTEPFDSLNNVRSKLQYGDIIEFKRVGYSHFSIYLGNNTLLQYETPLYNNITIKNVFSNFPSLTLINAIDKTSHGDPVRVNNKLRLNLPVNVTEVNERIQNALGKNGTVKYNIFFNNCEHFATHIRFGFGFSDQIDGLIKVTKDILMPLRKISFLTFSN